MRIGSKKVPSKEIPTKSFLNASCRSLVFSQDREIKEGFLGFGDNFDMMGKIMFRLHSRISVKSSFSHETLDKIVSITSRVKLWILQRSFSPKRSADDGYRMRNDGYQ